MRTAAEAGDPDAMEALGSWLQEGLIDERGKVVAKPAPEKAVEWFERAAKKSHPFALHQLAYSYDTGLGVEVDKRRAIGLHRRAVRAGLSESATNLAICYREVGNLRAYRRWIERAAEAGSTEGVLQLAEWQLARRTTKTQKKQAMRALKRLVREIKANQTGLSYYSDDLPRAESLLELGKRLGL
jgi:TPR repeat protein